MGKESAFNAGDLREMGSVLGSGRFHAGGHGNSFQYSFLENLMDRGAWRATVHSVTQSWTPLKGLSRQAGTQLESLVRNKFTLLI